MSYFMLYIIMQVYITVRDLLVARDASRWFYLVRPADIWWRDQWLALGTLFVVDTVKKIILCGVLITAYSERSTPQMTEFMNQPQETLHDLPA